MQNQTFPIADLVAGKVSANANITTRGWVRTRRDSKAGFSFIVLYDGSGFQTIQIVAPKELDNYENEILHLTAGCSIIVHGELVASPGKGQSYEIQAKNIEVVGMVDDPDTYPISPKHHSLEYLREHAHLRPRTNVIGAVTRVQNCVAQAIHRFFNENSFYWIHTPIITTNDCEGAGELFRVTTLDLAKPPKNDKGEINYEEDFFGKETFLTVSGQLNVESYCEALSKVYTFGPTFRAENSNTTRHLAEFWMVEPEIAFADLNDVCILAEDMLKYVCKAVLEERHDDMDFFMQRIDKECITRLENIIENDFATIEYTDAITQLQKANKKFEFPVEWGHDLQSEHERYLTEELIKKPVIVVNYPKDIKGFYMHQNDDGKTVAAMDVLAPGIGEIIGGSQREERFDVLERRMDEMQMNKELYQWYLDLRRYGT
ncbi:MAG: asparagine--tRNA ligase, partial [Gammaproteobacteria bacterium]|nr:asparagine--tRNA ligase [Gammaproteobacteria bacterium]